MLRFALDLELEAVHAWELSPAEQAEVEGLTRVDVAYTWHPGVRSYSRPPAGVDASSAPDLRRQASAAPS